MDANKNEQEQHTSITLFSPNLNTTLYPMFPTMELNKLKNAKAKRSKYNNNNNNYSFAPCEEASFGYSNVPSDEKSETDSCSEEGGDDDDNEEVSLECEELFHDGEAKKKIELLAAMVGVDTTEPGIVLAEVVRVMKHLERINQFYLSA
ncbi:hypothetical protein RIF29_34844 [Crotalaria pallida]|uniref:Uncharacterized protein n=1 Tax=Crotalaria pallida TaxID=3830 RepID=A0AAN9E9K7_CROPI